MANLIEVVLTFVATMLVLALAAQSLQDLVKSAVAWKAWTLESSVRRLLAEAARTAGLDKTDGAEIMKEVAVRLNALSQKGWGKNLRIDVLGKAQLMTLIREVDPTRVAALRPLAVDVGRKRLDDVACQVEKWFELAVQPVDERYRRRMRLTALGAGFVVVLAVNANAFDIFQKARSDPRFRAQIQQQAGVFWSADSVARVFEDSARADTANARLDSLARATKLRRDSMATTVMRGDSVSFLGYPKGFKPTPRWGLGILVATLLVGLGAPFWHDVLESVFGLKNRALGRVKKKEDEEPE